MNRPYLQYASFGNGYTAKSKADAVAYAKYLSRHSTYYVANNLGIAPQTLSRWIDEADRAKAQAAIEKEVKDEVPEEEE